MKENVAALMHAKLRPMIMLCSDNILFYSYVAFKTYEDLAEHLKQDAAKKFIKYALNQHDM